MDVILGMFGNLWGLLAGFGFVVAVGCGIWSGVQFMLAQGDPQKVAQARMGFVGVVVGLLMVGAAFVIPQVIQDEVIDDNLPVDIQTRLSANCDNTLQSQLRFQAQASNAQRMREVVRRIQLRGGECANDVWNPIIVNTKAGKAEPAAQLGANGTLAVTTSEAAGCGDAKSIGGIAVPSTMRKGGTVTEKDEVRANPGRDANGNIIVHFASDLRPGDNAVCWLYVDSVGSWLSASADSANGQ